MERDILCVINSGRGTRRHTTTIAAKREVGGELRAASGTHVLALSTLSTLRLNAVFGLLLLLILLLIGCSRV